MQILAYVVCDVRHLGSEKLVHRWPVAVPFDPALAAHENAEVIPARLDPRAQRLHEPVKKRGAAAGFCHSDFDAPLAQNFARRLYELGVLVTGFFYPVVPMGQARVRVQISAAHSREQLDAALAAFAQAGREFKLIPA